MERRKDFLSESGPRRERTKEREENDIYRVNRRKIKKKMRDGDRSLEPKADAAHACEVVNI